MTKSAKYYYDADAIKEAHKQESIIRQRTPLKAKSPDDGYVSSKSCGAPLFDANGVAFLTVLVRLVLVFILWFHIGMTMVLLL